LNRADMMFLHGIGYALIVPLRMRNGGFDRQWPATKCRPAIAKSTPWTIL
jgi:hypothetical protein